MIQDFSLSLVQKFVQKLIGNNLFDILIEIAEQFPYILGIITRWIYMYLRHEAISGIGLYFSTTS